MKAYIYQGQILTYAQAITHVAVSTTYPSDDHVALSEEQYQFHIDNPTATVDEVWNMQLTPQYVPTNEDIARQRQEAYKMRSDSYYMAYQKYTALNELEKAQASKTQWLEEVAAIDLEYPYL